MINPYLKKDYDITDLLMLAQLCQQVWELRKQRLNLQTSSATTSMTLEEAERKMKEHMTKLWGPIY